jgi:PilZ domain
LPENPSKRFELVEKPAKPRPVTGTRRWQRYPLDVPIRVIVDTPGKTKLYDGRGNELSEGGMAVTAGAELDPGREVAIEIHTALHLRPHPGAWHGAQPHRLSLRSGISD